MIIEEKIITFSGSKQLHISKQVFEGIEGIDIRWHIKFSGQDEFKRTKRGVFLRKEEFDQFYHELGNYVSTVAS